jgi:hypothetical protein
MKKILIVTLALAACFPRAQAQSAGQIIAAQYGEFRVAGSFPHFRPARRSRLSMATQT